MSEEGMNVGRIVASVTIENASDLSKGVRCDALVDTRASLMVLLLRPGGRYRNAWIGSMRSSMKIALTCEMPKIVLIR